MKSSVSPSSGVRAVIFDISGTVLDFGCLGPVSAFLELFRRHGVTVSIEEIRRPMGTHKRDHIWSLFSNRAISARWESANGCTPTREILDTLCGEFAQLQAEIVTRHADLIPGVPAMLAQLRKRGIKVVNTTGFESCMIKDLIPVVSRAGYTPDLWVCPDQVGAGRPSPWMIFHAARELNIYPPQTFVKVGDTPTDIAEGHAAGAWVVSVVNSGNEVGCSESELNAMPTGLREAKIFAAQTKLASFGPHYLIDTVADLIPVIDSISERITRGEMPTPADFALPVFANGNLCSH